MNQLTTYGRQRASLVWAILMLATTLSWMMGSHHEILVGSARAATVGVLVIAFFKVYLVGMNFMELRHAPRVLVFLFNGWVVSVCAVVNGIYLVA
ncbi:cytochrome C oxidase subunit IV family protein [Nocardia sp. NPDC059246]|uniref:cytochrome C oxidase subunit IV family protein n=1 Tax=unclassified Nocardia TaxID=2637762 RepID=UPI0036C26F68